MKSLSLAAMLTRARLGARTGSGILDVFAVLAFAVSSWLTLTTLGGVFMFQSRVGAINRAVATAFHSDVRTESIGEIYAAFAVIALALLTIPLLSLGSGAARLGAGGRERRLASLRLMGMSASQVLVMSIVESVLQATIGYVAGLAVYLATLPPWSQLTFGTLPISTAHMLLPWWMLLAAYVLVLVIASISTVVGLQRVTISPLGVAHRVIPTNVKMWRLAVLGVALALLLYMTATFSPSSVDVGQVISIGLAVVIFFGGLALAGPLFIQLTMRPLVFTGSPTRLIGIRRVVSHSRAAWRNVSAVALMGAVATLVSTMTIVSLDSPVGDQAQSYAELMAHDIPQGVLIAFAFSLVIGAVSTMIHQVSDVFDRSDETRALVYVGTPVSTLIRARFIQVMYPLLAVLVIVVGLSFVPSLTHPALVKWGNMLALLTMIGLGIALTFAAVAVTIPIQHRILSARVRRND
ncbi:FtsX-like permease family protein [Arcanobacterium phocae]|uniref:FtsX-like permease family protein n=1 Tax=Arcanobacterium phocae TaxID=131112 RepID=UPI001C0E9DA1|nr:FtsX-like permease family protein [Arcanobacterium phocae]